MVTPPAPVPFLYPDAQVAALRGARLIAERLREGPSNAVLSLGLSGGSTPGPLYAHLAEQDVPWSRVHLFWIDERFVPPTDERSNERLVRETLLRRVPVPETHIHPVPTDLPTAQDAADAYDDTLRTVLGPMGGLTVAVLGMGEDGHTASLFPGQPLDHPGRRAVHTLAPDTSPVRDRITVTRELLADSDSVFFFVTGKSKCAIVQRALSGEEPPPFPAAAIRGRCQTAWLLDDAAGNGCGVALVKG